MKESTFFSFFAAANGYSGFRSYFDEVFNPKIYTRIYILKGGPGTGKSTLMKSVYAHFKNTIPHSEAIYCSSDPNSLDGVILKNEDVSIAILDGTAPHEWDTRFPGAVDEIVNLGVGWDNDWLKARREKIIPLCEEKRNAYKTAYLHLRLSGEAHQAIRTSETGKFDTQNAKIKIKTLAELLSKTENPRKTTRLISAFGKGGFVKLDTLKKVSEKYIGIYGDTFATADFMNLLWNEIKFDRNAIRIPSPLDDATIEAIYFPDNKISIAVDENAEELVCVNDFYKSSKIEKERSRVFRDTKATYLSEAERWLKIASDLHSRLEDIYSEAMNFDINNEVEKQLIEDISKKMRS